MDQREAITGLLGRKLPSGDGYSDTRSEWRAPLTDEHGAIAVWRDHMDFHDTYHLTPAHNVPAALVALDEIVALDDDDQYVAIAVIDLTTEDLASAWLGIRPTYVLDDSAVTVPAGMGVDADLSATTDHGDLVHALGRERGA